MKFLSVALIATVALSSFTLARPVPGFLDDIKNSFNSKTLPWFVEKLTPLLAKDVDASYKDSLQYTLGTVPDLLEKSLDETLKKPWGGNSKLLHHALEPLQHRAQELKDEIKKNLTNVFDGFSTEAKKNILATMKISIRNFLTIGEHPLRKVNVALSDKWFKPIQKKLEEFHAEAMFNLKPALAKLVRDQRPMIDQMSASTIKTAVEDLANHPSSIHFILNAALKFLEDTLHKLLMEKVDGSTDMMMSQLLLNTNKILRVQLYEKVWFLGKAYADPINESIKEV